MISAASRRVSRLSRRTFSAVRGGEGAVVALTGASGYIGSHIAELLVEGGYSVRAIVREHSSREAGVRQPSRPSSRGTRRGRTPRCCSCPSCSSRTRATQRLRSCARRASRRRQSGFEVNALPKQRSA